MDDHEWSVRVKTSQIHSLKKEEEALRKEAYLLADQLKLLTQRAERITDVRRDVIWRADRMAEIRKDYEADLQAILQEQADAEELTQSPTTEGERNEQHE